MSISLTYSKLSPCSSIDVRLHCTALTMHLWQFNSRFFKCCLFYRKISVSFSSTVRDIYILVVMSIDERKEVKKCGLYTNSPVQISH